MVDITNTGRIYQRKSQPRPNAERRDWLSANPYRSQNPMILFQAQIEEHQKLAEHYRELAAKREALAESLLAFQQQADSDLSSLRLLVDKCKEVAPNAIASLKSAVLTLFSDGDDGNDGGNPPTDPTPDTDPDDDEFELLCLNGSTGDYLTTADLDEAETIEAEKAAQAEDDGDSEISTGTPLTYTQAIKNRCGACWGYVVTTKADIKAGFINRTNLNFMEAVNLERTGKEFYQTVEAYLDRFYYNGQSCEWASPLACPLCSLLWEDAPLSSQACEWASSFACVVEFPQPEPEKPAYTEFVEVSVSVGYIKVQHSGEIKATYAGFTQKQRAEAWGKWLAVRHEVASDFEVRLAKHLPFKWELKLWGLNINQINRLAEEDLSSSPHTEVDSAKPPKTVVVLPIDKVKVGQRIRTKNGLGLTITSAGAFPDRSFFARNENGQRHLLTLDDVAEFLAQETPAQAAGIEPPSDWGKLQQAASSKLFVEVLLKDSEYYRQTLPVSRVSANEIGYTVTLPNGDSQWFRADTVQVRDASIEENALPTGSIEENSNHASSRQETLWTGRVVSYEL